MLSGWDLFWFVFILVSVAGGSVAGILLAPKLVPILFDKDPDTAEGSAKKESLKKKGPPMIKKV